MTELEQISQFGMMTATAVTVVPFSITTIIANSKKIIFEFLLFSLDCTVEGYSPSAFEVPRLWKFSKFSAKVGITILAVSILVYAINKVREHSMSSEQK